MGNFGGSGKKIAGKFKPDLDIRHFAYAHTRKVIIVYEVSFSEDMTADQLRAPLQWFKMDDLFGDLPPPCNTTESSYSLLYFFLAEL